MLNSCCKGPLVLIYKSEKSRLFSKYITPPLGNKFYQCMILEKSFGCLFPEGFLVCLLGFFIIESFLCRCFGCYRVVFYSSLSYDAFSTKECKTSNLPLRNRINPTEYCSPTMLTTALAVVFLTGSTKLKLQTIWKSSNIDFHLGSLFFTMIRLGYFRLLSIVLEVTMRIHEPKKLYQIKTSTLEYYSSRLDFTSHPFILFIVGQQKQFVPYAIEILCSVCLSTIRCSIKKMEHETNRCSTHRSCLFRTLSCDAKSPTLVISSFDFSQSLTLSTEENIFDPAPIARLGNFEMPCQLVLLFFLHCAQHPLLSNWLAMASLQVLISFKFTTYIVTASISMESASLTHF